MLAQLVDELITEGAVQGSTKGGGGSWVPTVHTAAQQSAVAGFYNQNGWVAYDLVRKAGISNEKTYLSQKFPEGIALDTGGSLLMTHQACASCRHSGSTPDVCGRPMYLLVCVSVPEAAGVTPVHHAAMRQLNPAAYGKASLHCRSVL